MERSRNREKLLGYTYVLIAAALWALFGSLARLAFREGVTPIELGFWRCIIAWALFAAHVALRSNQRGSRTIASSDLFGIAAFGVIGIAVLYAALPLAVQAGGAALAVVLLYTAPAWVALLAWLLLGEKMDRRKILAVAMSLIGISALAIAGNGGIRPTTAAIGWGLAASGSYASMYLFGKRYFSRYDPATVFVYALPVSALALLPFTTFRTKSATAWTALFVIGVCSTYGAYLAYGAALRRLEATRVAVTATAEPVIGAMLAFTFWHERFTPLGYVAALLVLFAVVLMASTPATPSSET